MPPCAFAELQDWSEPFVSERDAGAGALGGDGGREPGGAASDHEHVDRDGLAHDGRTIPPIS